MQCSSRLIVVACSREKRDGMSWGRVVVAVMAWIAGLGLCWLGLSGRVAQWQPDLAMLEFGGLVAGAIGGWWFWRLAPVGHTRVPSTERGWGRGDVVESLLIAGVSLGMSWVTARELGPLPPAYHDEYSYLFQAQTFLAGRWTWPSPPVQPELFDQMHLLNEGRLASRYYPGTGAWLAPWLWLGNVWRAPWAAGALTAVLLSWVGRWWGGPWTGRLAGLTFALAPGPALFQNMLLAHAPCLLGLSLFLWGFVRGRTRGRTVDYLMSGVGLGFALLCRPATGVAFGLPFGLWAGWELLRPPRPSNFAGLDDSRVARIRRLVGGYGPPLLLTCVIAGVYNQATTGDWRTSSYQRYTDLHTPRHVFGLNNVVRGEARLGPKVIEEYDRWAENLTPELANRNLMTRCLVTGLWTIGLPLLTLTAVWSLPWLAGRDAFGSLLAWSVVSMHAVHWAYWYVGIMGWHYVYETTAAWGLLFAFHGARLVEGTSPHGRIWRGVWLAGMLGLAYAGIYGTFGEAWPSRWREGISTLAYPRRQHAAFEAWVMELVGEGPALVLIDPTGSNPHLDYVVNDAGLSNRILYGRYRPGRTDLAAVVAAFPDRRVFLVQPDARRVVFPAR